jgi:hypothetical protein
MCSRPRCAFLDEKPRCAFLDEKPLMFFAPLEKLFFGFHKINVANYEKHFILNPSPANGDPTGRHPEPIKQVEK